MSHLTEVITELVQRAEAAEMGYLDFVDLLLEEEVGLREGRRFRNAETVRATSPQDLGGVQFAFPTQPRHPQDPHLATREFVKTKSNVALLGPPGVGKTMLAVALAVAACQAVWSIYFTEGE